MTETAPNEALDAPVELDVIDQPYGPEALARLDGMAVFVSDAVPGDRVRARITEVHPRYARAETSGVLVPSSHRVEPECPVAGTCGGCQWQTMAYGRQLAAKERAVLDALERIGGWDAPPVRPILPSPETWHYRNKARYSVESAHGTVEAGYYARKSRTIVPISSCPLNLPGLDGALESTIRLLGEARFAGFSATLHAIVGRQSLGTGEVLVRLLLGREAECRPFAEALIKACPSVVGVLVNRAGRRKWRRDRVVAGQGHLTEHVGEWRYRVSGAAFFQVNPYGTPALVAVVREAAALTGSESVIDAYGGVGLFSVALAREAGRVTLIEADRTGAADAANLFRDLHIDNAVVSGAPVERAGELAGGADVIVCDPPREGAGREALAALETQNARRFVYVACDPTSLARDSALLRRAGYGLTWAQPVDLFPHTYHVETVALFQR